MSILKTRYSTSEWIVILFGLFLLYLTSENLGWGYMAIAGAIILFCLSILYFSWIFKIRSIVVVEDKKERPTDINSQINGKLIPRLERTTYVFTILLVIVNFIIIPSLLIGIFGLGSVFVAGMSIIAISLLCAIILIFFPWPCWMRNNTG